MVKKAAAKSKALAKKAQRVKATTKLKTTTKRTAATKLKATTKLKKTRTHAAPSGPLTHTLDALLHTMRCIAQHEDELCTLLHDARRSGRMSAPLLRELRAILSELPADEYTDDLRAVQQLASVA